LFLIEKAGDEGEISFRDEKLATLTKQLAEKGEELAIRDETLIQPGESPCSLDENSSPSDPLSTPGDEKLHLPDLILALPGWKLESHEERLRLAGENLRWQ